MPDINFQILHSDASDGEDIEALYRTAFPDEDLVPVVRQLLSGNDAVLSLVAREGDNLVGHILFTMCSIVESDEEVALLAPLVVHPRVHRSGIGSALIKAGLDRLKKNGVALVLVLGDPAYYNRSGFKTETGVKPPYQLPAEWTGAWQSQRLNASGEPVEGKLLVPPPWQAEALWLP